MDHLWAAGEPQTVRQVHEALSAHRDLAYTTVMTVLQRLARKNLVSRSATTGPTNTPRFMVATNWSPGLMVDALDQAADSGDRQAALVHFVERVGADEAEALRRALAELETEARISLVRWRYGHRLRDTGSVSALAFALVALLLVGPVPALLARASWPMRAPRAAVVLWQSIAAAAVLSAFSAGLAIASRLFVPGPDGRPTATITSEIAVLGWPLWLTYILVFALTAADRRAAGGGRRPGRDRDHGAAGRTTGWWSICSGLPARHARVCACCTWPNRWPTACRACAAE